LELLIEKAKLAVYIKLLMFKYKTAEYGIKSKKVVFLPGGWSE